jgi:hypothetical protein
LKAPFLNIKESLPTKKNYRAIDADKEYQNAALSTKSFYTVYRYEEKKKPIIRPLAFY